MERKVGAPALWLSGFKQESEEALGEIDEIRDGQRVELVIP
jgi:hypothetical protein